MASRHQQTNIEEVRRKFANGELGQLEYMQHSIIESWLRSKENGLSFGDNAIFNPITRTRQKRLEDKNHEFILRSTTEMENLFSILRGGHWAVSLIDTNGIVIKTLRESMPAFKGIEMAFRPGVNLGETAAGTTGPACVLADGKLAVVSGQEHFLNEASEFTCTSAPIYDHRARLVGVLNASRRFSGGRDGIPVPVMLTAQAIGNNLVRALPGAIIIDIACPLGGGDVATRGSLAINPAGEIIGASQTARQLLGIGRDDIALFAELFAEPLGVAIDRLRAARHGRTALTTQSGLRIHASTCDTHAPQHLHGVGNPSPQASDGPLPQNFNVLLSKTLLAFDRDIPILINGETGTGKEIVACYLHEHSRRAKGPFIALNCSSIPTNLIESELFGYEPGAFTGAAKSGMPGKLELANGGTLFLDEIGDMSVDLQARLLRVIQERRVYRLGGSAERKLDFSLISATHRDLPQRIAEGLFREDLYYRVNGLRIKLPALKERADFNRIVDRIIAEEADDASTITLSGPALNILKHYAWPGNIRELRQVLKLACAMSTNGTIEIAHLPPEIMPSDTDDSQQLTGNPLELAERDVFASKFTAHRGNISAVARTLGLARATVYKKLRDYRII